MKKILTLLCVFVMGLAANAAATPEQILTFLNEYINAANTYSQTVVSYYSPDAKIIRTGINAEGKKVTVVVNTKEYFKQMRLGQNLARINKYKNTYTDKKITKSGSDYKIVCTRKASTGADKFPSYFIIGEDSNGKLKIKEEMTTTKQQAILKHGK